MLATDNNLRKKPHHPHYLYSILSFRNFQACNFTNKETFQKCFYRTQKHSPRSALQKKCQNPFFNKDAGWGLHFYLLALTFSWEFWELFKCSFFDRIPPVAVLTISSRKLPLICLRKDYWTEKSTSLYYFLLVFSEVVTKRCSAIDLKLY